MNCNRTNINNIFYDSTVYILIFNLPNIFLNSKILLLSMEWLTTFKQIDFFINFKKIITTFFILNFPKLRSIILEAKDLNYFRISFHDLINWFYKWSLNIIYMYINNIQINSKLISSNFNIIIYFFLDLLIDYNFLGICIF